MGRVFTTNLCGALVRLDFSWQMPDADENAMEATDNVTWAAIWEN